MAAHDHKSEVLPAQRDRFATTHWSMVVRAGGHRGGTAESGAAGVGHAPEAGRALATLCENYWFPLYAFVRRAGHSAEDAQDLTQEFFVGLLAKNCLAVADPQRGKFRSFLLGAMKHFLANQQRRQAAQKRGGRQSAISLDFDSGENRYRRMEPADNLTPERLYEKRWALALLDLVFGRLREEFAAAGKLPLFDRLKQFLATRGASYREVAEELALTEGAVKVAVHRMRRRYRELLKEEIAQTVTGPEALEDELRDLLAALASEK
ncbi:MAG: sigma-70 family RNA polymerase sigma factor [Thermoguttaceae bacterium]|jgi:RNA polymerase sigma-70 factor (ECF subfamily)